MAFEDHSLSQLEAAWKDSRDYVGEPMPSFQLSVTQYEEIAGRLRSGGTYRMKETQLEIRFQEGVGLYVYWPISMVLTPE